MDRHSRNAYIRTSVHQCTPIVQIKIRYQKREWTLKSISLPDSNCYEFFRCFSVHHGYKQWLFGFLEPSYPLEPTSLALSFLIKQVFPPPELPLSEWLFFGYVPLRKFYRLFCVKIGGDQQLLIYSTWHPQSRLSLRLHFIPQSDFVTWTVFVNLYLHNFTNCAISYPLLYIRHQAFSVP